MTAQIKFLKCEKTFSQIVVVDGKEVGSVKREEIWTVRGNRVVWNAYRNNLRIASFNTRAAAAAHLVR